MYFTHLYIHLQYLRREGTTASFSQPPTLSYTFHFGRCTWPYISYIKNCYSVTHWSMRPLLIWKLERWSVKTIRFNVTQNRIQPQELKNLQCLSATTIPYHSLLRLARPIVNQCKIIPEMRKKAAPTAPLQFFFTKSQRYSAYTSSKTTILDHFAPPPNLQHCLPAIQ